VDIEELMIDLNPICSLQVRASTTMTLGTQAGRDAREWAITR
jgi:hypothetical protein